MEIRPFVGRRFTSSRQVLEIMAELAHLPTEAFLCLHLDGKNKMVGMTTCSMGLAAEQTHKAPNAREGPTPEDRIGVQA